MTLRFRAGAPLGANAVVVRFDIVTPPTAPTPSSIRLPLRVVFTNSGRCGAVSQELRISPAATRSGGDGGHVET